jgi:HK97 family phage prohead protease
VTAGLEHKAVETQTHVANDLGEFSAFAATYDVDRVKDRIRFGAFEKTIANWQASGKRVPLHWAHRGEARNVIGSADPARMREVAGLGLYVEGKLDLDDSAVARETWRSMKDNRVGLSFGYMTVKSERRGGINDLLELDLYEISIAPGPINPRTRILEMKSRAVEERNLRRRCDQIALEAALAWEPIRPSVDPEPEPKSIPTDTELRRLAAGLGVRLPPRPTSDFDYEAVRRESFDQMLAMLTLSDDRQANEGVGEGRRSERTEPIPPHGSAQEKAEEK